MKFRFRLLQNGRVYNEQGFGGILADCVADEIDNPNIEMISLSINTLDNHYENDEVYPLDDIETVYDLEDIVQNLEKIENFDEENSAKLEAMMQLPEFANDSIYWVAVNDMEEFAFYYESDWYDLAEFFCSCGVLGKSVKAVYNRTSFIDIEAVIEYLKPMYTETKWGIIENIDTTGTGILLDF